MGSEEILKKKAKELLDCSRIFVAIVRPRLLQKYPELYASPRLEMLSIYGATAVSVLVCIHLHHEVEKELRTQLEMMVQESLKDLYPDNINNYWELIYFFQSELLSESDRKRRMLHIHRLATLWILNKIGFISDPLKPNANETEISNYLADLFLNESSGYWTYTS